MTKLADLDTTYIDQALARIADAIADYSGYPAKIGAEVPAMEQIESSFWIVLATMLQNDEASAEQNTQTWLVYSQLLYKTRVNNTSLYAEVYTVFPGTFGYMQAHKRLIFSADQSPVAYLDASRVKVDPAPLNNNGQPGFIIIHRLPFEVNIEQEW